MIPEGYGAMRRDTDNAQHGQRAKVAIRQHVLEAVTPARARVFDAFAGTGKMFGAVWHAAAEYVGCDEAWHHDARCCYVADNRRVLRALSLARFTVFDLDAYGSPWEQALIIAARRQLEPGERAGLVLTDGCWTPSRLVVGNVGPKLLRHAAGVTLPLGAAKSQATMTLYEDMLARAIRNVARQMRARVVRQWQAVGITGMRMRYIGVVLDGVTATSSATE